MSSTTGNSSGSGPTIIVVNSVLAVIATLVVGLRFWSRRLTGARWGIDEYLVLASLLLQHGIYGLSNHAVLHGGLGRDINVVMAEDPGSMQVLLKVLFTLCFLYGLVSPLIKLSVLVFYMRVFPTRGVRVGAWVIGSLCIGWFVAITTVNCLQCTPLTSFWNPVGDYKCIDLILYFVGNSIANCVIDVLTLVLPIREVLRLHISRSKKACLCGVFLLGGIVVVASFVRFISLCVLYKTGVTNLTEQYVTMWIATAVEIWIAIIGACLPTVLPACRKLRYGTAREGSSGANRSLTMYQGQTPGKGHGVHTIGSGGKSGPRSHIHPVGEGTFELLDATQCDGCSEQEVDLVGGSQEEGFQRRVFGGKGYNSSP